MKHSGRNSLCPICSRDRKDYCRWDDSQILCYRGQSFGPPDLEIGEVIKIDGVEWAYVKDGAGFSNNSAMFVRHDESTKPTPPANPAAARRKAVRSMYEKDRFERDVELAEYSRRLVEDLQEFADMNPDQLRESLQLCADSFALHGHLITTCRRLRRELPDLEHVAKSLQEGLRAIRFQQSDLQKFFWNQLLDPGGGRGQQLAQQLQGEAQQ